MPANNLNRFFISIVLPSILAIAFFILLIFALILPSFEKNIVNGKKETISELTNTAWSLLEEYSHEATTGEMNSDTAKYLAAERIRQMRFGKEYKDYFWIIDKQPVMIMHPYRTELIDTNLSDYKDPDGKRLFMEAVRLIDEKGEGFIDYKWQWKDDSTRIVPKLSYVKEFKDWDWIIGTGIYLEDVQLEINSLKKKLLLITMLFTLLLGSILAFIIRQSLNIEHKRKNVEKKLMLSRQKYKSLVEASTEGTLMIVNEKIIFSNQKFSKLSAYPSAKIVQLRLENLFGLSMDSMAAMIKEPGKSISTEARLNCGDETIKEVVLSVSEVSYSGEEGYILIVKEVSSFGQLEQETDKLSDELQTELLLINQAIKPFINEIKKCNPETSVKELADFMTRKDINVVFVSQEENIMGVINNNDLKKRVLAPGLSSDTQAKEIMTAPVQIITENALLYEAILKMQKLKISHLATADSENKITGVIAFEQIVHAGINPVALILKEIESAESIEMLQKLYLRFPVIIRALIESGNKTVHINRIITSVADAILQRIIFFAMEDMGPAPVKFAFMVLGSEGRMEQTLATDQDNAIIFDDTNKEKTEQTVAYFLKMAENINRDLHKVGYKLCPGEVMAKNPKWTQPLSQWKNYFTNWIDNSSPQDILDAAIFFDFRCVYGEEKLVNELREHINKVSYKKAVFFHHMAQSVIKFKWSGNLFGSILGSESPSSDQQPDIKKVMFPLISFIRLYSIREQLLVSNSLERLDALFTEKHLDKDSYREIQQALSFLMFLRLKFQVKSIFSGEVPGNHLPLAGLTSMEINNLKKIFSLVSNLQTKVGFDFGVT
jgi:signal-transduction protein with cAMP-binding, CBS, and nucleotidyltransferase domain/PAS domain-containing protein